MSRSDRSNVNPLGVIVAVMSLVVLGAFSLTFLLVAFADVGKDNEALAYVWTGISVLVGSVVAVAYGQPESPMIKLTRENIIVAYAIVYMAIGVAAVGYWIVKQDATPQLIENAATTFLGLLLPIVSAFLKPDSNIAETR